MSALFKRAILALPVVIVYHQWMLSKLVKVVCKENKMLALPGPPFTGKHQQKKTMLDCEQLLDSIPEVENKPPEFSLEKVEHMANIFGAISAGISRDNVGLENEFYGSSAEEEIDIDAAISSDSDDSLDDKSDASSEELESEIMQHLPSNSKHHPKAIAQQVPIKAAQKQASKPKLDSENFYDLQTSFTIQCAVHQQDGDNAPFKVLSTISLDQLCTHVAEKHGHFPGLVSLHYWLDSDKVKAGAILIRMDAELEILKARL
ncbi:hypothetical protein EDC04DRAFT_3016385 [Pisolithus marmoratus]|nr:hypothetical protein EDC04DRAFT_3016385 [Pisolithus marmoratus]